MEKLLLRKRKTIGSSCRPAPRRIPVNGVQRKDNPIGRILRTPDTVRPETVPATGGRPLPESQQSFFGPRFGRSFSHVRIHTDAAARRSARQLSARAFTMGSHIYFAKNEYAPGTTRGRHLMAHELTHTIHQQAGGRHGRKTRIQRSYCPTHCAAAIRRGCLCKSRRVTRDNCAERGAASRTNKITHIRVLLGSKRVNLFWNGAPRTATGTREAFSCNPNASTGRRGTPRGWDKVGVKCGINHTSWKRYNMAWFTAFRSTGYGVGFHNSQPLTGGPSHGCVRVSCENARKINRNSVSNYTSIIVR